MKLRLIVSLAFLSLPSILFAQGNVYSPLVDLSNAGQGNQVQTFEQYINFLYGMSIAVAALLAVIKIVIAGAKYMMSDVIGNKEGAKTDIQGAVLGLLLILSAVIILELINPQLTEKNISFPDLQSPRGALNALATNAPIAVTVNPDGSVTAEGAPRGSDGNLLSPIFTKRTMSCYGNWCPERKYVSWTGTLFSYNLEKHCTEFAQSNTTFSKADCVLGISRALTKYDEPEPDYFGFCYENAAARIATQNGVVSCQLPTRVEANEYFKRKFEQQQSARSTDDIANNGASRSYDEESDFEDMCKKETHNGQAGTFYMISDDILDFEEEYYRCVWYN